MLEKTHSFILGLLGALHTERNIVNLQEALRCVTSPKLT